MYWPLVDTGGPRHTGSDGDPALPWAHSSHPAEQPRNKESPESSPYIGPAQTRKKEATALVHRLPLIIVVAAPSRPSAMFYSP